MENTNFKIIRDRFLTQPMAFKEVEKNEIVALDGNVYRIGSAEVELDKSVSRKLDSIIGLKQEQSRLADLSYGSRGVANLRNFFAQTKPKNSDGKIVFVANTKDRTITDVFRTDSHIIPPDVFFDFAEMFMDKNRFVPDAVEYDNGTEVSIRMKSLDPKIMSFGKDDDFVANGLWLKWSPVETAFGNYYERLVCSNGMTETQFHKASSARSLDDKKIVNQLLSVNSDNPLLAHNVNRLIGNAQTAMKTMASVHELGMGTKILQSLGVKDTESLIPYQANLQRYMEAGYNTDAYAQSIAVSDTTVWDLFNRLTAFASHTQLWQQHDPRRTSLMSKSVDFLNRQREIKEYSNIYAQ